MAFKKTEETVETVETVKEEKTVKVRTEEELAVLPREEYLEAEKQIKEGKAKILVKINN